MGVSNVDLSGRLIIVGEKFDFEILGLILRICKTTGRPRFCSVRLRFGGGRVRAVPVFGSGGSSAKGFFCVSVQFNREGRFRFRFLERRFRRFRFHFRFRGKRFRRFRFPVPVRFLSHPETRCKAPLAKRNSCFSDRLSGGMVWWSRTTGAVAEMKVVCQPSCRSVMIQVWVGGALSCQLQDSEGAVAPCSTLMSPRGTTLLTRMEHLKDEENVPETPLDCMSLIFLFS